LAVWKTLWANLGLDISVTSLGSDVLPLTR
jgi:hypothetical protein